MSRDTTLTSEEFFEMKQRLMRSCIFRKNIVQHFYPRDEFLRRLTDDLNRGHCCGDHRRDASLEGHCVGCFALKAEYGGKYDGEA